MFMQLFQNPVVLYPLRPLVPFIPAAMPGVCTVSRGKVPSFDEVYQNYVDKNGSVSRNEIHFNDQVIALMGQKGVSRQEVLNDPKAFLHTLSADELMALHTINGVPISLTTGDNPGELTLLDPLLQVDSYSEEGCLNLLSLASEMVDLNKDGDAAYGREQFKTVFPPSNAPGAVKEAWDQTVAESSNGVSCFVEQSLLCYGYAFPSPPQLMPMAAVPVAYGPIAYSPLPAVYVSPPYMSAPDFSAATERFVNNCRQNGSSEATDLASRLLDKLQEIIARLDQTAQESSLMA